MYTPESHAQMYEILAALRAYAGVHTMPALAESIDDAIVHLADEGRGAHARPARSQATERGQVAQPVKPAVAEPAPRG